MSDETTTIDLEPYMYWARCSCGYSMRLPSPHDSTDKVKMPIFCCGCGKRIVYTGAHRWQPKREVTLTLEIALTLISEKVRFWSDEQVGPGSERLPARCMDMARLAELRQSLLEINAHCKSGLAAGRRLQELEREATLNGR